jgi:hypothetical protein
MLWSKGTSLSVVFLDEQFLRLLFLYISLIHGYYDFILAAPVEMIEVCCVCRLTWKRRSRRLGA